MGLLSAFRFPLRLLTLDLETKPVHQVVCSLENLNLFLAHCGTSKEGPYLVGRRPGYRTVKHESKVWGTRC